MIFSEELVHNDLIEKLNFKAILDVVAVFNYTVCLKLLG